jgi:hypothetical protein
MYRKSVFIPEKFSRVQLVLLLGYISDIDETFFNGQCIGKTGSFPLGGKDGECKGSQERAYVIPSGLIKFNQINIIAVRVFDNGAHGGIYKGYIGIAASDKYSNYSKLKMQD